MLQAINAAQRQGIEVETSKKCKEWWNQCFNAEISIYYKSIDT